jgi:hypothetical protein
VEKKKAFVEVQRRVFDGGEGASLVIEPYDDGFIAIRTNNDTVSEEWFGKHNISFSPKVARAVAECLLKCADECERID